MRGASVAAGHEPAARVEQPQPVGEACEDVAKVHRPQPGRGQLDRQRDTVDAATDFDHLPRVILSEHERGAVHARPLDEQPGVLVGVEDKVSEERFFLARAGGSRSHSGRG
jgi:hypothetical protein